MVAHLQGIGGGEDSARQLGRRIERQSDRQVTIAHHVPDDSAVIVLGAACLARLLGKKTASVKSIAVREAFVGFLAIEKD
jgi:hypothetical protein